jgi:hypothetical protein
MGFFDLQDAGIALCFKFVARFWMYAQNFWFLRSEINICTEYVVDVG